MTRFHSMLERGKQPLAIGRPEPDAGSSAAVCTARASVVTLGMDIPSSSAPPSVQVSNANPGSTDPPEVTPDEARAWLSTADLLEDDQDDAHVLRRYLALSKCKFGTGVSEYAKRRFLRRLIPYELRLAAKQTDIGEVTDPRYHYQLRLNNATPVRAKPMRLRPTEEAWLDVHLDELLAKGVIGPILPHE